MTETPSPRPSSSVTEVAPARRSRASVVVEVVLWALFAVAVGVGMILLSERLLPANF